MARGGQHSRFARQHQYQPHSALHDDLYKELEEETGQSCGIFQPGSLYLAQTEEREHQLKLQAAKAKLYGMNFYEVSIEKAKKLNPMVNYDGIRCVMFEPDGGNVDPSGVTNGYAVGARNRGAEIHRFTPVTATEAQEDGTWVVKTPKGDIATPWVINAAGLWGREVACPLRPRISYPAHKPQPADHCPLGASNIRHHGH